MAQPLLLPLPRQIAITSEPQPLVDSASIYIADTALVFAAQTAQTALRDHARRTWTIRTGIPATNTALHLRLDATLPPQGYQLRVADSVISISGSDSAGVYYGVLTLTQLLRFYGEMLPDLTINDHPDFPVRGVMLDISRDRVPTLPNLYALVDLLASWKLNQLQLYMEHSFAYAEHPTVWRYASPFTPQEILELDAYCRQRHIDLVPNQNSLGHMERWLKHPEYRAYAECPDGFIGDFGDHMGERRPATSLNPIDPASIALMSSLYDDLLPHFSSPLFNIGGDEPWELGQCASRSACETHGRGRVYIDHLLKLHEEVSARGRRMMFWADVILKYPDLLAEMPRDAIALQWGYSAAESYDQHAPKFAASGLAFYVCPGTSSWNSLSGRTANALGNLLDAAQSGLAHGAAGYLITDWGDRGHWQPQPISYPGFAYGLALAWNVAANRDLNLPAALDHFVFNDSAGIVGQVLLDLGNLYQFNGLAYPNGSLLFFLLQLNDHDLNAFITNLDTHVVTDRFFGIDPAALDQVRAQLSDLRVRLAHARMRCADAALIHDEIALVIDLLAHACARGLAFSDAEAHPIGALLTDLENLIAQQRLNWVARCRPGGLKDSLLRFEPLLRQYRGQVSATPSYL